MTVDRESIQIAVSEALSALGVKVVSSSITLAELYQRYVELEALPRGRCHSNYKYAWAKLACWANRQAHSLTRAEVQEWFMDLGRTSGQAMANRTIAVLSGVLNWGIKFEHLPANSNPCVHVDRFKMEARDRFLSLEELERFNASLEEEPRLFRDFFKICLLTGARIGNVKSLRWEELDLTLGIWRIPKTKNGSPHNIPLTVAALSILKDRKPEQPGAGWVFPGDRRGKTGHITDVKRAWTRILKRAEIKGVWRHDMRRTRGSYFAIAGFSLPIIGQMLGHRDQRSSAIYARLNLAPVREAAERVDSQWQALLDLPTDKPRLALVPQDLQCEQVGSQRKKSNIVAAGPRLSAREQISVEAKIITVLKRGDATKKRMYSKIGACHKVNSVELERILTTMEARGIVTRFRDESNLRNWRHWRYRLA